MTDDFPLKPSVQTVMLEEAMERHGMPEPLRNQALDRLLLADAAEWAKARMVQTVDGLTRQLARHQETIDAMRSALDEVTASHHTDLAARQAIINAAFGEVRRLKKDAAARVLFGIGLGLMLGALLRWILT